MYRSNVLPKKKQKRENFVFEEVDHLWIILGDFQITITRMNMD